jgi:phosphatidylglycerol lysyltransferase
LDFPHPTASELARARALILDQGWNATAYQILNPGISLWFASAGDAVAGYRDWGGVRVVAGAPVCAPERLDASAQELEQEAYAAGTGVCYFAAGSRLEALRGGRNGYSRAVIGAQPVWDPARWAGILGERASLRAQLNRARNKDVSVEEWPADRAGADPAVRRCLKEWLAGRHMPPMGFLVEPRTLPRLWDRRVFVASRGGRPLAFLTAAPVPVRNGWLVEQIVRGAEAPNGTAELLVDAAFGAARDAGIGYFTLGLAPLSRVLHGARRDRENPLWLDFVFGWLRAHGRRFYDFQGLEQFKAKFRPDGWEPIYAICKGDFSPRILLAIAAAFAGGSPFRFLGRAMALAVRQEIAWLGRGITGRR